MQSSSRVSAMEMIRSNDKYNLSIHHDEGQSTSAAPICKHGHCKVTRTETRPIQRKKQVRRRIHTSKPYQERLLNMAEARKEIVTALKLHRASMKRQRQQEQKQPGPALMRQIPSPQQELPTFMDPAYSSTAVQDYFTNLNAARPASDPPTTGALQVGAEDECSSSSGRCEGGAVEPRALDEEEMAQIRSIGEMHQMEWDDTLNFATYSCWFRFLQEMELSGEDDK